MIRVGAECIRSSDIRPHRPLLEINLHKILPLQQAVSQRSLGTETGNQYGVACIAHIVSHMHLNPASLYHTRCGDNHAGLRQYAQ